MSKWIFEFLLKKSINDFVNVYVYIFMNEVLQHIHAQISLQQFDSSESSLCYYKQVVF